METARASGGGVHGSHSFMGADGPLGEHIRLAFQLSVLVQHFQRTEQVIAAVIGKGQPIRPVVDKAVLGRKGIIEPIQLCHLFLDAASGMAASISRSMSRCTHSRSSTSPLMRASAVAFRSGRTMRLFSR